ncbi:CaiB/BaiF CoA transferase family protein [Hydrogenophaga sp. BPS33]|uniref:CaiB/BaiF CoA transferase family protein n=1 Tax=Hydrogenophaga sp. BPS33 TaxID=2651974 RepID=UPI0013203B02|nr:CaiB/BaiF CoA-transferase family protein [Hydrogenophaga sp. BPS33]QHE83391.1 CoA transferase [Hydrogenophaga sp. BPS33]
MISHEWSKKSGPLAGVRVVEFASLGPGPFCAMQLADLGADVIRIERPAKMTRATANARVLQRGCRSLALDLKRADATEAALRLVARSDILIEGYRPGVMERLGLGPETCLAAQPKLIYGRMTGWGQSGPLAQEAGHDINYIAVAGVLNSIGEVDGAPIPPLNLVGDFGGGGMMLALCTVSALLHSRAGGAGQVVDIAMFEGAASLMAMQYGMKAAGRWDLGRGCNIVDGAAPFYRTYRCSDSWIAVGAVEPQFFKALLRQLDLTEEAYGSQHDKAQWPRQRALLASRFATRRRDEWCAATAGSDVCLSPVLDMEEAALHPHSEARKSFTTIAGVLQPAPVARLSETPVDVPLAPPMPGEHSEEILRWCGFDECEVNGLLRTQ